MLRFILLTGLYLLGTWYATAFIGGPAQVTLFWPSAGLAFAAVLRYGWRHAFFIPVAVLIAHLTFVKVPLAFVPFSVLANFLGALAGGYAVKVSGVVPRVRVSSGFGVLRGGLVMVLVSGLIGTTGLVVSHMVAQSAFFFSALLLGVELVGARVLQLGLWATVSACVTVLLERRFWPMSLAFALALAVTVRWPELRAISGAVSSLAVTVNVVAIWRRSPRASKR